MNRSGLVITTIVLISLSQLSYAEGDYNPVGSDTVSSNTAVGNNSQDANRGSYNTAVGYYALDNNVGVLNTAVGYGALRYNSTSEGNTAIGANALSTNSGSSNTAIGSGALQESQGSNNTANGAQTLHYNSIGNNNTALGKEALYGQINVGGNLISLSTGSNNTAAGYQANYKNTSGNGNVSSGYQALYSNTTGNYNTTQGYQSMYSNTTGTANTSMGRGALARNSSGDYNNAFGVNALYNQITGSYNLALGADAGKALIDGSYNVYLNNNSGTATENNTMRLGSPNEQTKTFIAGIYGVTLDGGVPVYIDAKGQLGTVNSSARFKADIQDMGKVSEKLYDLRPVTYRYKDVPAEVKDQRDYGLIAEEVAKVYPDLIAYDDQGQIQTVQYQKLVPMLLNEVQALNKKNQVQEKLLLAQNAKITLQDQHIAELQQLTAQVQGLKQTLADVQKQLPPKQTVSLHLAKAE